jgi:hypothetical protein
MLQYGTGNGDEQLGSAWFISLNNNCINKISSMAIRTVQYEVPTYLGTSLHPPCVALPCLAPRKRPSETHLDAKQTIRTKLLKREPFPLDRRNVTASWSMK